MFLNVISPFATAPLSIGPGRPPYPAVGSLHEPISPTAICVCGDGSGANIAVSFLQLLLHLRRQTVGGEVGILWNGRCVPVPFPAAIATHSGYLDLTRCLPSETTNLEFDIIPSPALPPVLQTRYLQDDIWPPQPPRHHVYAPTDLLTHHLVSPVTARNWQNCPTRVWLSVGQECLKDGSVVIARRMAEQGVDVQLEIYLGMPHDFLVLLQSILCGQECLNRWAAFAKRAMSKQSGVETQEDTRAIVIRSVNGERHEMDIEAMEPQWTTEELIEAMEVQIKRWGEPWARLS